MTRATLLAALSLAACSPEPAIETNVPLPPEDASTQRDVFDAATDAATDAVSDATDAMDVTVTPDVAPDVPCGAAGSACCPGSRCNEGVCAAGRCAIPTGCGAMGDPCCAGERVHGLARVRLGALRRARGVRRIGRSMLRRIAVWCGSRVRLGDLRRVR